ncbi:MAG: hypothetical protein ACP5IL_07720 [Syntrophobacteraceae bacterium]
MVCVDCSSLESKICCAPEAEVRPSGECAPTVGHLGAGFQSLESLVREGAGLKREIEVKTARLRGINLLLAERVRFEEGRKSSVLIAGGYKVRVRLHENITWDQERIATFRKCVEASKFFELFRMVYEPTSTRAIEGFIAHADKGLSEGLKWCMSVRPGAPQLAYEKLD